MKKYLPLITIPIFLILLIIILIDRKENINTKVITVNANYSNLYNESSYLEFNLYINNDKHPLIKKDAHRDIYIKDKDSSNILSLNLLNISYSHSELFLNETYYYYNFIFDNVNLTNDFLINESYLKINLENNETYEFKMGKFNLMYLNEANELPWDLIDSKKDDEDNISINKLIIKLNSYIDNIESIYINKNENLTYSYNNNELIINLKEFNNYYHYNLPLIIKTNNDIFYINNYKYFTDYNLLTKSSNILNIYEVN